MTLHEAIELILQESGVSMTSREIADEINKRKLYTRRDNNSVPASQITSRANNYDKIFAKEYGKIKLLKDDIVSLEFQKYRNILLDRSNQKHYIERSNRVNILLETLKELSDSNDFISKNNNVKEPAAHYGNDSENPRNNLKVAYKLCNWYFQQDVNVRGVLSDQFGSIISGLDWFANSQNLIKINFYGFHHFLLKVASENQSGTFKIQLGYHLELARKNHERFDINLGIKNLINNSNDNHFLSSSQLTTKIIIHPFNKKGNHEETELDGIISEIENSCSKLDRAIVIVPSGVLMNRSKSYVNARKKLVLSNTLTSTVTFPNGIMENTAINLSLLLFNFNEKNDEIFFYDVRENFTDDTESVLKTINRKEEIKDISKRVLINDLGNDFFDLYPKLHTFNPHEIDVKKGYKKYSIKKIIDDAKSGSHLKNRNSLYAGGEYKLIRTSEINRNSLYFQQNESMLGIDHDESDDAKPNLVSGGIVVSGFNKKIKASILSSEETYVLGQDVFWVKVNPSLVLEEYLINEIYKPYVSKQVQFYSKGSTISRLSRKDFLNIQVQLPSIGQQKEILFDDFRKQEISSERQEVSNNELDFIKTLKHSLKQPASGIGNDLSSLRSFLDRKIESGESLAAHETIVPVFDTDPPKQIEIHTLANTLDRMGRAITDIDYILEQAMLIITATGSPIKENIELKPFLSNFISENPEISIKVTGSKVEILADRKQLRILINNFIDNAKRHGFIDHWEKPSVWMEIRPKDSQSIQISIRNNGKRLPPEFTTEDFLAKGQSSKQDVGSGFGGFLIGQILKNHSGSVELIKPGMYGILPHNVEFLITLPK